MPTRASSSHLTEYAISISGASTTSRSRVRRTCSSLRARRAGAEKCSRVPLPILRPHVRRGRMHRSPRRRRTLTSSPSRRQRSRRTTPSPRTSRSMNAVRRNTWHSVTSASPPSASRPRCSDRSCTRPLRTSTRRSSGANPSRTRRSRPGSTRTTNRSSSR